MLDKSLVVHDDKKKQVREPMLTPRDPVIHENPKEEDMDDMAEPMDLARPYGMA